MNALYRRPGVRALLLWAFFFLANAASSSPIQLVSSSPPGQPSPAGGNGDSCLPLLSADGRFVLFASTANNLLLTSNGFPIPSLVPAAFNVYLRDRTNQTTRLISINPNGTSGGNGNSFPLALSTNGQFVLFQSSASNLISGDSNNATDVFLRDLMTEVTWLVSVNTNGVAGNGASRNAVMTPDGRYVAFVSEAFNLAPGDTNRIADVFVRDMQAMVTTRVSLWAAPTNPGSLLPYGSSEWPEITPDGRFIAFVSTATNLVPGVRTAGDIYVHDRIAGTNLWVSSGMRAQLQAATGRTNGVCYNLALSEDGKYVAYQASLSPLGNGTNTGIVLRYGLETDVTDLICTNVPTSIPVPEETRNLDITPNGQFIAFVANSNGLQATTTSVHVWDATSGLATLVSGNLANAVTTGSLSTRPVITPDGRYVAFLSSATNLVTNSISGPWHLYLRDLFTATTVRVNAHTNVGSFISPFTTSGVSADGRFVAFDANDGDLVLNDDNRSLDVFVRDLVAGTDELISVRDPSLASASPEGPSLLSAFASSADGRFVAFSSDARNLVSGDTNGFSDVFVRDLASNSITLVSVRTNGLRGNGASTEPAISRDGRWVAFTSTATNLVTLDANRMSDVFVRDLQSGAVFLASPAHIGLASDSNSYSPVLSADARWVLFRSGAKTLVVGTFSGPENLFLSDMQSATTVALTRGGVGASAMTPDGRFIAFVGIIQGAASSYLYVWDSVLNTRVFTNTTSGINGVTISPDGNRIAFHTINELRLIDRALATNWLVTALNASSRPVPRLSEDGNWLTYTRYVAPSNQVFLYDIQNRAELLVSHAMNSALGGAGHSDSPELTIDGRFVAYRTLATNIVAGMSGITRQIVLYNRQTGLNTLASVSRYTGMAGDDHSLRARFSADGQTLLLQSWASDLAPNDFNHSGDVLAGAIFTAVILPGSSNEAPWIYWPSGSGNNYGVQFKNKLDDQDWQPASGIMTNAGNKVWFQDGFPTNSQRFYRIQSY